MLPTVNVPEVVKSNAVALIVPAVNGFVPKLEANVVPFIATPLMKRFPPKYKFHATPTPPETTNAPVVVDMEGVVLLI